MKPACSIVIRAFNEGEHLGRLFEGISRQTIRDMELILVDSGSSDGTVEIAKKHGATILHIKPEDFTFGRSLNLGIEAANSDIIIIASAHVYPVYPDWIERMIEPFRDSRVALVYGKQRGVEESHYSEQQIFKHWYPDISTVVQDHPFCNNANAAIRRSFWENHRYDESLPGLEDLAWAKWAYEQNFRIVYSSQAEIRHVHEESWAGIKKRYLREGMAFKSIYPQENFSLLDLIRLFFSNAANDLAEAAREKKLRIEWANILRFRWQQFHGTYLGYRRSGPLTWQLKQSFYYPRNGIKQTAIEQKRDVKPIEYHKEDR
jgi:glycosyltransferase involved in cell wall biosynthesis